MSAEKAEVVVAADESAPTATEVERAVGGAPNISYAQAIEWGKIAAASGLYPDARSAARAAIIVAKGAELGLGPTAALDGIHILEKDARINFIIEGRLLGALVERRADIKFVVVTTTDEEAELEFLRMEEDGWVKPGPNLKWDVVRATRAGLWGKHTWKKHPNEMLRWRALAEGVRLYFPGVIAGTALYVEGEIDDQRSLEETLSGPAPAAQLDDEEAEGLRDGIEAAWKEVAELNPDRITPGRFRSALRSAGHSHAELRGLLRQMSDLRDTETVLQAAIARLKEVTDEKTVKEVVARAERRGDQREKVDVVRHAVEEAEGVDEASVSAEQAEGVNDGDA